jgi:long-chain acyl-CoA synthetase
MNPLMQAREVQFYRSNTGASALFGSPGFEAAATKGAEAAGFKPWIVDDAELAWLTFGLPSFGYSRLQHGLADVDTRQPRNDCLHGSS